MNDYRHALKNRFLLLIIALSTLFSIRLTAQCDPVRDSLVLVAFYHATNGDDWIENTNWLLEGQPLDTWYGIQLEEEGCVAWIELVVNGLTGEIPSEIGNLSQLRGLAIQNNNLQGLIPSEIGSLSQLRELDLAANNLQGPIPPEIGNLINLEFLELTLNQLASPLPPEIGNLTSLEYLRIRSSGLTGSLPPEIGNLPILKSIDLAHNQLTGSLPVELGNLSTLVSLLLNNNQLTGSIPLGLENTSLFELDLFGNQLTGPIPTQLGDLSNLYELNLSSNQLTGTIPIQFGNLSSLRELYLSGNQLTGTIPSELGNIVYLSTLALSHNELTGHIPPELGNSPYLFDLYLNDNQLSGSLPREFAIEPIAKILNFENNLLSGCFPPEYTAFCGPNTGFRSKGNPDLAFGGDLRYFCALGLCSGSLIEGHVVFDETQNCSIDEEELGLQNWMIKADSEYGTFYSITDEEGYYRMYTIPGEFQVELIPSTGPYWTENCTGTQIIDVQDLTSTDTLDFFPSALEDCPNMTVDISTAFFRRCFANTIYVEYCNNGTTTAEDAYIEIQLDELINIESASIPIGDQNDNMLLFELGDVPMNHCETFQIYTNTSCDAILGQTLCNTAHIYPDSVCTEISPEWSGATVEVKGNCIGDQVRFTINNVGEGNMLESESYIVVEDGLILLEGPTPFILDSQAEINIDFPANGSTYFCQPMQVANHPFASTPTAYVEGCGTNENGGFSTGYVVQLPEDDNDPFISVECREVIGSFDPNDKRAFPHGYEEEHYIEKNQDIEYHIRFQNTGNDTAFLVVVEDVISPYLDMSTFRPGSSSHPYSLDILGGDTLFFIFEDIFLVDSFVNEPASHGFVKFKISQKEDLPLETRIENTAGIYFDFNEPVITNTTWHTIGENFIQLVATSEPFISDLKVALTPNPVLDESTIRLSGIDFKTAEIHLFDILGTPLRQESFQGKEFSVSKGELLPGIYLFEIRIDGRRGFVGKMTVQ